MFRLERTIKALANRRRLAILVYLKNHPRSPVTDVAQVLKVSVRTASKHLRLLALAELVDREQRSLQMLYSLVEPRSGLLQVIFHLV